MCSIISISFIGVGVTLHGHNILRNINYFLHVLLGDIILYGINLWRVDCLDTLLQPMMCEGMEHSPLFSWVALEHVLVHSVGKINERIRSRVGGHYSDYTELWRLKIWRLFDD